MILSPSRPFLIPSFRPRRIIRPRTIRLPRQHKPWCPLYRRPLLNMAAGDELLDSSGNVILDSSGNVQLSDGAGDSCCCRTGSGTLCSICTGASDLTPRTVTAVISVSMCSCTIGAGSGYSTNTTGDASGTYTLTQNTACQYIYSSLSGPVAKAFTGTTCSGSLIYQGTGILIKATMVSGPAWQVTVFDHHSEVDDEGGYFVGNASVSNCTDSVTINNRFSTCGTISGVGTVNGVAWNGTDAYASGGTVVLTPNF